MNNLAYCLDRNALLPFALSSRSFLDSNKASVWCIWILDCGLGRCGRDRVKKMLDGHIRYEIITVGNQLLEGVPVFGHVSHATYGRLFLADLLPGRVKKVLYLDADTFVCADLLDVLSCPLDEHIIGAVKCGLFDVSNNRLAKLIGAENAAYFNAGVLLVNLEKWRENCCSETCTMFIRKYGEILLWWDQDVMNGVFFGRWSMLPEKFNHRMDAGSQPASDFTEALRFGDACVLHFAGSCKPWSYNRWREWRSVLLPFLKGTRFESYGILSHRVLRLRDKIKSYPLFRYLNWQFSKIVKVDRS